MNKMSVEQKEMLQTVGEYLDKLIPAMQTVIGELRGEKKDDTSDFLTQIVEGINFVLEAYNLIRNEIDKEERQLNEAAMEQNVQELSKALLENNDANKAICVENMLSFMESLKKVTNAQ